MKVIQIMEGKARKMKRLESDDNDRLNRLSAIKSIQEAVKYLERIDGYNNAIVAKDFLKTAHRLLFMDTND